MVRRSSENEHICKSEEDVFCRNGNEVEGRIRAEVKIENIEKIIKNHGKRRAEIEVTSIVRTFNYDFLN